MWDIWDQDLVISVDVNDLAPNGAKPSAGIGLTTQSLWGFS